LLKLCAVSISRPIVFQLIALLLACSLLSACGGGGGGGSSTAQPEAPPDSTPPEDQPIALAVLDSMPVEGANNVNPFTRSISLAHPGQSDLSITYDASCAITSDSLIRRRLFDLSSSDFDQVLQHRLVCNLEAMTNYTADANGTRPNDARFRASLTFSTGAEREPGLQILDEFSLTIGDVNDLFTGYLEGALFSDLDIPGGAGALLLAGITDLAEANWRNLVHPGAQYPVRSQRVSYLSRNPDGDPDEQLTGLIAMPVTGLVADFVPRNRLLVLTHATGSTPGDLNFTDAWFILANLFASHGYLVVAPDNYGRGGTSDAPETYLMADRTALNALDLVQQVVSDESYDHVFTGSDLTIIGYSQGGHSAMALWALIETTGIEDLNVTDVYAGGAPHNLYETFLGVVQHIAGECNGGAFCRYVDTETTVPFATELILPGFLSYTDTGLTLSDIVTETGINPDFVSGFLSEDPAIDNLKALLALSSFTNIESVESSLGSSGTKIHLYHSRYDRLVPVENSEQLAQVLTPHIDTVLHENRCNADGHEVIFNLTDKVGVVHTLCGLSVLDRVLDDLQ
jgi:pimeloyl-ACP methyl ester carboxylesterase